MYSVVWNQSRIKKEFWNNWKKFQNLVKHSGQFQNKFKWGKSIFPVLKYLLHLISLFRTKHWNTEFIIKINQISFLSDFRDLSMILGFKMGWNNCLLWLSYENNTISSISYLGLRTHELFYIRKLKINSNSLNLSVRPWMTFWYW